VLNIDYKTHPHIFCVNGVNLSGDHIHYTGRHGFWMKTTAGTQTNAIIEVYKAENSW